MKFDSIAITGHTSGMGKALYEKCRSLNKKTLVYSRTNGFDISDDGIVDKILLETKDVPVFVNNAYHETQQLEILKKWFQIHRDQNHLIINISSIAADLISYDLLSVEKDEPLYPYALSKREINRQALQFNVLGSAAKAITIDFGLVDTPFSLVPQDLLERSIKNKSVITSDDAANIILKNINDFTTTWFQSNCLILNCVSFKR